MAMKALKNYPYPVIAMLNGDALGAGCALAVSCDIRIAAEHARMGIPTTKMGLVSDYEGFQRFITVMGYSSALEIFMTGRFYDARTCLELGMVNHVVESDQLEPFTYEMAHELAGNAPLAVKNSKYILNRIVEPPRLSPEDFEEFRALSIQAARSDDHEEAKRAFREKRKPQFTGR
jgi:enoyl-CoA hydratase